MPKTLLIEGKKFAMLTVIKRSETQINSNIKWDCLCDCGNTTSVTGSRLKQGITKSCGCIIKVDPLGYNARRVHGFSSSSEYQAWSNAKLRCFDKTDPQYKYYGGRGIVMQDSWARDFKAFISYIGNKPEKSFSLDRIDNDLGYYEGNVRWATKTEQVTNRGMQINNTTGITGVSFVINPKNGFKHYKAAWGPKSNLTVRSFSVSKFGEEMAFKLAVDARTKGLQTLIEDFGYAEKHGKERLHR